MKSLDRKKNIDLQYKVILFFSSELFSKFYDRLKYREPALPLLSDVPFSYLIKASQKYLGTQERFQAETDEVLKIIF